MTEFIKKIDLLNAMARIQPSSENYSSDTAYWAARDMFDDILFQINAVTDAETEYIPVVHAHWIEAEQENIIICSNCGHREFKTETRPGFCCRRCTAKMDEVIE